MPQSPFAMFDVSQFIFPYLGKALPIVLLVSVIFVAITVVILLYHWWRYSDNFFMTMLTVSGYFIGAVFLLLVMLASL